MQSRFVIIIYQLALVVILGVAWEILAQTNSRVMFLLSAPSDILRDFGVMCVRGRFLEHFAITGGEALAGLALGTILGSIGGIALWLSHTTARVVKPFVVALGSFPIFALAPLMIVWFGIDLRMKIAMATFATVFVAFTQSYRGARAVDGDLLANLVGMGASRWQMFTKVIVPGALDSVFNSMRINVGLALLGAFIGEFIASDRGLGHLILRAAGLYDMSRALAASLGIIALAVLLDQAAAVIERHRQLLLQVLGVPRQLWGFRR